MTSSESPAVLDVDREAMLADRYGRRGRTPRAIAAWIVGGVAALALLGYVIWGTLAQSFASVDADTVGFTTPDAHSITITFQVTLPTATSFACALEAQDEDHGIVGWRIVEYAADPAHTRTFVETLPTTAPATTGLVRSCWIP